MVSRVKEKTWFSKHPVLGTIAIIFGVLLIIGGLSNLFNSNNSQTNSNINTPSTDNVVNQQNTQTPPSQNTGATSTPSQTTKPIAEEQSDKATMGEKNALKKAQSYLDVMAFSYSGLIKQLEYEGFTHQEAEYGVNNVEADWNEQAALKAQSYLDVMPFSRDGLIKQLEYEGFTKAQAEYGVQAVGY
jgi:hypothetical protein